jgi:RHS repeat-associated protein
LQLSATDTQLSTADTVTVTVTNNQANQAPVVNAGVDQIITLPSVASLSGTVTDDGLPNNQLVINWSKISGAGTVVFSNPTAATTTASFSAAGVYVLRLEAGDGQLSASDDIQITANAPASKFDIMASPTSVTTVQNSTATYMITIIGNDPNFQQLVGLSISTLPGNATASFNPQQVVAGASSTLTINLNNSGVVPGTYNFTVTGSASIGGMIESHTANLTLVVQAAGQTTLSGRVLSSEDEPLSGVVVSIDGQTSTTDAAGAFLLSNVTAGNNRAILVDGRTASSPGTNYPVIAEPVNIVAGQPNQMPYIFYLPRIDTQYEVTVVPTQNTTVTTPRVNGLSTLIPANSNLRNRDGSAVTRVSMTPVPIDKTPAPLPSNLATTLVYTNQPGGAIADVAMPVIYPNLAGSDPGTIIPLYTFNHDRVEWVQYGVGKVSLDGRTIVPEINPATNKPYGLPDFSWHFAAAGPQDCPSGTCSKSRTNKPVALSTGVKEEIMTDIAFGGARGGLSLSRIYTSDLAITGTSGQFGRGTRSNWEIRVTGSLTQGGAARVTWPEEFGGRLFNYVRTDPDGTLVFTTTSRTNLLGDELKKLTNGNIEYRSKNGDVMKFDSTGRLTGMVDRNNNTTTLTYSGNNLVQVTDPVGRSITMAYDGQGRIISATDPIARTWTYTYGGETLATATDPLGNSMQYTYGIAAKLETVRDKRGNIIKTIVYGNNRVISQTFADGGVERYDYFFAGSVISSVKITDPENRVTLKRFNGTGYVIFELDGLGQPSVITRDINNNLETQTNGPCGCPETQKAYNSKGDVVTMTDRLGQIIRYEYDPLYSFVTKTTDKNGHITQFTYDSRGNRTSVINAKGETTTFAYDSFGQQTSMTDALNHTWSMVYDTQGNVTSETDPLTNTSTVTYDGIGRTLSMSDPLGRTSSMTYDAMSRVISTTDAANSVTTFGHDENGNTTSMTNALNNTWTVQHDSKNRRISQRYPLTPSDNGVQREMRMEYNKNDELTAEISASGRTYRYTYDARGARKSMTDPLGAIINYVYDINNNLVSLSDFRNKVTSYEHDELDRVTKITDPLGQISSRSYDLNGNITSIIDRLGRTTTISYDIVNRPITITYADATMTYQYDTVGRKTRVDDTQFGGTFIAWAYDNANRLLSETTPQGTINYTYNADSQRTSMIVADRPVINYVYDTAGRLNTIDQNLGQSLESFTYSYDILSRRTSLQRPNGVTTTHEYDQVNRLKRLKHQKGNDPAIEDLQYIFNADDEISSISSINSTTLLPEGKNISVADANNRISTFGAATFNFDAEGQSTSKIDSSGTSVYSWDHRGRLKTITLPNNQEINYSYDALNRRISLNTDLATTQFLYSDMDVVLETDSIGERRDYLNGLSIDEKLRQSTSSGEKLYFNQNHLGSTIALTNSLGISVDRIVYDPFGNNGGSTLTRYNYTGREIDSNIGLIYYRNRWYDLNQGRFLSEDPIEFNGGANFYDYVHNSPINYIDPLGLQKTKPSSPFPPNSSPFPPPKSGTFSYGNYCGVGGISAKDPITGKKIYPDPIDQLDVCCKAHDDCYGDCPRFLYVFVFVPKGGLFGLVLPSRAHRKCDRQLCDCAGNATCASLEYLLDGRYDKCESFRKNVRRVFCTNAFRRFFSFLVP